MARRTRGTTVKLICAVAACAATACVGGGGGGSGGGGGGGSAGSGGAPGAVCAPTYQAQGCHAGQRVQCQGDGGTGAWALMGTCPAGTYCSEEAQPDGSGKKLATCKNSVTPGADAGGLDAGADDVGMPGDAVLFDAAQPSDTSQPFDAAQPFDVPVGEPDSPVSTDVAPFDAGQQDGATECDGAKQNSICGEGGDILACASGSWVSLGPCPSGTYCTESVAAGTTTVVATCKGQCGNGSCDGGENAATCPQDCASSAVCGDLVCLASEDCNIDCDPGLNATGKCLAQVCGGAWSSCVSDGSCVAALQCIAGCQCNYACEVQCAQLSSKIPSLQSCLNMCPLPCDAGPVCGDGSCEAGETANTCPNDCAPLPPPNAGCGGGQDAMFLQLMLGQPTTNDQLMDVLATCTKTNCLNSAPGPARTACVAACAAANFDIGLPLPVKMSDACWLCFGSLADCSASLCTSPCAVDANAPSCMQCQTDKGCSAALDTCKTTVPALP